MSNTPPDAIEINAAQARPAPRPVDAPTDTSNADTLAVSNRPDPTAKTMFLGGVTWDCIDEIPAGRMADIIEQQLELNEAQESNDPMKQVKVVSLMLGLFDHFVTDAQLPALNEAMRNKSAPISLNDAITAANDMLNVYMRGEPSAKS